MDGPLKPGSRELRWGRTTGSCAAAASKAASLLLLTGDCPGSVDIPLPDGTRLTVPVAGFALGQAEAVAWVFKDGGDDPDVTHGAEIRCRVRCAPGPGIEIQGGIGVGLVTRPGLAVTVGRAAINPVPLRQIEQAVAEARIEAGSSEGLEVLVEVPEGEKLARKTLNPRLGIVGGISILGTQGRVKPFSHEAYRETIDRALDVALAAGLEDVAFSTGRRSEKFLRSLLPDRPMESFIQAGDFFAHAMRASAERGFSSVVWGLFWGKVVKQSQGLASTHAKDGDQDFEALAAWAAEAGLPGAVCEKVATANTARQVWDLVRSHPQAPVLARLVCVRAATTAMEFAGRRMAIRYLLLDEGGAVIADSGRVG